MKRVLLFSSVYPPEIGGPSLQTKEIAEALRRRGIDAQVLTFLDPRATTEGDGAHVHRIDGGSRTRSGWLGRNVALLRALDAAVVRLRPDLLHVQVCDGNASLYAGLVARRRGVPALVKFSADLAWNRLNRDADRGLDYDRLHRSSLRARRFWALQKAIFEQYPLIWATSPFQADALRNVYGIAEGRIHSLPNLVRIDSVEPPSRECGPRLRALLVSRLVPWKGVEDAIAAVARPECAGLVLRIVGGGSPSYVQTLKDRVTQLGLADRVEFAGAVSPDVVAQEFRRADLFVGPSLYEPFGIVFVQAMEAGLPVVATRIGGIPSIVEEGKTGLLVPARRPDALAAAMARLAADPDLRAAMGLAARRACQAFDLEARFEDLLAMYERLVPLRGLTRDAGTPPASG